MRDPNEEIVRSPQQREELELRLKWLNQDSNSLTPRLQNVFEELTTHKLYQYALHGSLDLIPHIPTPTLEIVAILPNFTVDVDAELGFNMSWTLLENDEGEIILGIKNEFEILGFFKRTADQEWHGRLQIEGHELSVDLTPLNKNATNNGSFSNSSVITQRPRHLLNKFGDVVYPEIEELVASEFAEFPVIRGRDIDRIVDLDQYVNGIAVFEISNNVINCLNWNTLKYGKNRISGHISLFQNLASKFRLPNIRFALNHLSQPRVLVLENEDGISIPNRTNYVNWVKSKGVRIDDALSHPAIFSPMPHAMIHERLPIFSISKIRGLHSDILIPTATVYASARTQKQDPKGWNEKKPILYWRGSTTGGYLSLDRWSQFQRVRLAEAAKSQANTNIGLTAIVQAKASDKDTIWNAIKNAGLHKEFEPFERVYDYKYLYELEGNSYSARLELFLRSNSVVFKPTPLWEEFYYPWLKPGEHYVEMNPDFDDLAAKMKWAEDNQESVMRIAQNATDFSAKYLSLDFIEQYILSLLWKYDSVYLP